MSKDVYAGCATNNDVADATLLGGQAGANTLQEGCKAQHEGRYGHEALMAAKLFFHDIPVHQFSAGDSIQAAATPTTKANGIQGKSK